MSRVASLVFVFVAAACGSSHSVQQIKYPDGGTHWEYERVDGIPHGTGRVFYPDGTLKSEGPYVHGSKQGVFVFFDEEGTFTHQVYYWKDSPVWQSTTRTDSPPPELITGLLRLDAAANQRPPLFSRDPVPAPYFTTMDRTSSLSRMGLQAGVGNTDAYGFGSVMRLEAFANYRVDQSFGLYGQFSQTVLTPMSVSLIGRQTFDVGGTYQHAIRQVGDLTARLGLVVPVGNDNVEGFVASASGASQRPADAAATMPAAAVVRTSASVVRARSHLVLQADAGVDWVLGSEEASFDALLRGNVAAGIGARLGMLTLELTNTVRASDPARRLHAIGVGGTFWFHSVWLTSLLSRSFDDETALTLGFGYEL